MTIERNDRAREDGMALVYVGVFLVPLLLCTGLAVDLGRGYLVRVALAKAVDAAALAAARNISADSSQANDIPDNIFSANFPAGFLGVSDVKNPPDVSTERDPSTGAYIITVSSTATVPTTFMRLGKFDSLRVAASARATRRLVDMSFVLDRSGSLSGQFPQVKEAAKQFVSYFEPSSDRIALITFSDNTVVEDSMRSERGFDPASIDGHIDNYDSPGGATATAEALYRGWDQLRTVPFGSQGELRIVVLFTDGSPNSLPGQFQGVCQFCRRNKCGLPRLSGPVIGTVSTLDYPNVSGNKTTYDNPIDFGLLDTNGLSSLSSVSPTDWMTYQSSNTSKLNTNDCIPTLPLQSYHAQPASMGIRTAFDLNDPTTPNQRGLRDRTADGYPNHVQNANNAARNLAETIANNIRNDTDGSSRIRIYTLGLGDLLTQPMGSRPETGASILKRIANDRASSDFNPAPQLEGKYFFAGDASNLETAFAAVRDQFVRLTQ